jgi:nitrite reductase (NO-forming)
MKRSIAWVSGFVAVALASFAVLAFALGAPVRAAQESSPSAGQAAACASGTPAASPDANAAAGTPGAGQCVTVGMYDIYFDPNVITIPADTDVTVELVNHGVTLHNFSVTDHRNPDVKNLGIDVDVDAGQTQTTTINAPEGTYYFYCNVPGHEAAGMFGYLKVEKGAKIAAETATVTPPAGS